MAETINRLAAVHGGRNVRVIARTRDGRAAESDLGLLVDMSEGRSLLDLVALDEEPGEALGIEVKVWTEGCLSPYLREAILSQAMPLRVH